MQQPTLRDPATTPSLGPTPAAAPAPAAVPIAPDATAVERPDALLEALLFSVSHDLKSPLLTLSLSSELLGDAVAGAGDQATVAASAMRRGVADMERLLDALTAVSRARRRALREGPVPIAQLLRGHIVVTDGAAGEALVAVDPRIVVEALEALSTRAALGELRLWIGAADATVALALPAAVEPPVQPSPLGALFDSLHTYAGTAIETLAVLETQLTRQGGQVWVEAGRVAIRLPRIAG